MIEYAFLKYFREPEILTESKEVKCWMRQRNSDVLCDCWCAYVFDFMPEITLQGVECGERP